MTLGEKIRLLRRQQGLSQEELSFTVEVARQTISKWESDTMQPTMDNIKALCTCFKVDSNYFLDDESSNKDDNKKHADNVTAATVAEATAETKPVFPKKFIVLYSLLAALSAAICALCLAIGIFAISINYEPAMGYTEAHIIKVDWLSIVCFIIAFCALAALITIIILIVKRKKRKM